MGAPLRSAKRSAQTDRLVIIEAVAAMIPTLSAAVLARNPRPTPQAIATALAHAFLAAEDWSKPSLISAAASVLGARRRWLGPLAEHILGLYHRRPADAPRELVAVVLHSEAFETAVEKAAKARKPIIVAHYVVQPAVAREARVPHLDTLAGLAGLLGLSIGELEWFADPRQWNRTATSKRLQHYRYQWRSRPGKVPRLLEIPQPRLRALQRTVLHELLAPIPLHNAAHGFVPGRSAVSGARAHTGAEVVVNLDLAAFFAHVTPGKVFGVLRQAGFTEAVAHRLTGLCTHAVPGGVIAEMPPGGDSADRFALRKALALPHLPQGAPTSPMLANLALRRLDSRLSGWAGAFDAGYTRYADDLAFSGGSELARRADAFVRGAARIVADEGHALNRLKTRVHRAGVRQSVTGVVVNQHTNVTRGDFDALKAVLHNCVSLGPEGQNRDGQANFRAHLMGRVAWVSSVNPGRGATLRALFERIVW
ncbi:RNA-directed DNA polymerase [Arthrobacter glacialis]|uniref:RNA-directed DNA polymerase n=1 Tax=Arthrobacter glacialis TaxID=1664 RepID=A0A2S4A0B5_ARTGL|nr:RNA-directed DNA polymerase [Arthrobacter glacialis]